mgnify:FL=1
MVFGRPQSIYINGPLDKKSPRLPDWREAHAWRLKMMGQPASLALPRLAVCFSLRAIPLN